MIMQKNHESMENESMNRYESCMEFSFRPQQEIKIDEMTNCNLVK